MDTMTHLADTLTQIAKADHRSLCRLVEGRRFDDRPFEESPLFKGYGAIAYAEDEDCVDVNYNNICATIYRSGTDNTCVVGTIVEVYHNDDVFPISLHNF